MSSSVSNGVLLWECDPAIEAECARRELPVARFVPERGLGPFEKALVTWPGARVPWRLVQAGFGFLDRWEAAAPLLERDLAEDLGRGGDRRRTLEVVRDLRVPVYEPGVLLVRDCDGGVELLRAWVEEMGPSTGDSSQGAVSRTPAQDASADSARLAFVRALYRVKPLFLALPRSWLKGELAAPVGVRRAVSGEQPARQVAVTASGAPPTARPLKPRNGMVQVEIAPGRYVCCKPEEAEMYKARFEAMRARRRG